MKVDYNSLIGKTLGKTTLQGPYVGLELEYEKCKGAASCSPEWHTDIDHSLRTGGVEFISIPLEPEKVSKAVDSMLDSAIAVGAKVTPRCGLHVHLNATHMTWREMYSFVVYYTLLEPTLFYKMAPGREMSHFCVPTWTNTALTEYMYADGQKLRQGINIPNCHKTNWTKASTYMAGSSLPGQRTRLRMLNTPKYAALNIASLKKFGTLEFRQAPSSLDPKFIKTWVEILLAIQKQAMLYRDPEDIVVDYELNGLLTLCEKVGLKPATGVDSMDQEDAADTATIIAGHVPVNWKQLTWEVA